MSRSDRLVALATELACSLAWLRFHESPLAEPLGATTLVLTKFATHVLQTTRSRREFSRTLKQIGRDARKEFGHAGDSAEEPELVVAEDFLRQHLPE
jgi:hypothetical protein